MTVRRAGPRDLEGLLPLAREYCIVDQHEYDDARVRAALGPLLENDALGVVWIAGEPPAGYAVVTWGYSVESGGREALLDEIYVCERNQGMGARLLQVAVADAKSRGLNRMFLETESPNEGARRFYARHGFQREDSVWMSLELLTNQGGVEGFHCSEGSPVR
jgi:GNAT superfamily N-acetyltransferase